MLSGTPIPESETLILAYLESVMFSGWGAVWRASCDEITSNRIEMLPPSGVYLQELESRFIRIFPSLSSSTGIGKVFSLNMCSSVMPFSLACSEKMSTLSSRMGTMSFSATCRGRASPSRRLKSIIWFTSLSILSTLLWTVPTSRFSSESVFLLADRSDIGPEIRVRGVRNSCATFAKKFMFILLILLSCSFSCSALCAAAALRRALMP